MKKRTRVGALFSAAMLMAVSAFVLAAPKAQAVGETIRQQAGMILDTVPNTPGAAPDLWDDAVLAAGPNLGFVVANPMHGPGDQADADGYDYTSAFEDVRAAGTKVVGYVDTGYFGASGQKTRNGQTGLIAWRAQVLADINAWYSLYGGEVDGIFFDRMDTTCGSGNATVKNYRHVRSYVEENHRGALTVGNAGKPVASCYEDAADTLITFAGSYDCYQWAVSCPVNDQYSGTGWTHPDPRKFMHLVHSTPSGDLADAVADSKARYAGYVYVTDDADTNPWDSVPGYLSTELAAMPAGGTSDTTAPTAPSSPGATPAQTQVDLTWTKSTDAGSGVVGYDVYDNNSGVHMVTSRATAVSTQTVSLSGLAPNTTYDLHIKARDGSGNESAASSVLTFTTLNNTGITPWTTIGQPSASGTTYTSTDLGWNHSQSGQAAKAYYEVLQDGVSIQKITGALNGTHVVGLQPGTTYSFTIRTVDLAGLVTTQSTARVVTTPALPTDMYSNPLRISAGDGEYLTNDVVIEADYNLPWTSKRVYLDVDNDISTGYEVGFGSPVGADYIIENGVLYVSNSNDQTWDVTPVSSSGMTLTWSGQTHQWTIPKATLSGLGSSMQVYFDAFGFGPYASHGDITVD